VSIPYVAGLARAVSPRQGPLIRDRDCSSTAFVRPLLLVLALDKVVVVVVVVVEGRGQGRLWTSKRFFGSADRQAVHHAVEGDPPPSTLHA